MSILLLSGREVNDLLAGQEAEILSAVRRAYEAHARNQTALPFSTFLRFPADDKNRVIALPAYIGDSFNVAGIKWISSFPGNIERHMNRASAVIILNSTQTGRPEAIIEGSIISAKRTGASAALAAQQIHEFDSETRLGFVGTGPINFEVLRFLLAAQPLVTNCVVFDVDETRATQFARKCAAEFPKLTVETAATVEELLASCKLISLATNASRPHISDLSACSPGSTILHVSLRDLTPEIILASDNIVDDVDHVCRAQTSVHLAEQLSGNREFIRCTLGDILTDAAPPRRDENGIAVFSPFGLGILDLAVSSLVCDLARARNTGAIVESFLPAAWV
ncbi:MAG TPA: 2,3-diaminopropionate biosynthesis protein SbnB [Pyrinomonadaceae bacterium]